ELDMGKAGTPFAALMYRTSAFGGSSGFNPLFRVLYAGDSNPMGSSFYDSHVGNMHPLAYDTMWSDSIRYYSPTINNFSAGVIASPEKGAASGSFRFGGSLLYSNGRLTLGAAAQRVGLGAPITNS